MSLNSNGVDFDEHETTDDDDDEDIQQNTIDQRLKTDEDEESTDNPVSQTNLTCMAPMSSISEVTLASVST